jgi:hypothetical protein
MVPSPMSINNKGIMLIVVPMEVPKKKSPFPITTIKTLMIHHKHKRGRITITCVFATPSEPTLGVNESEKGISMQHVKE